MKEKNTSRPRKRRTAAQRVVGKLLVAVDKSIEAAKEAKLARDELVRLSAERDKEGQQ